MSRIDRSEIARRKEIDPHVMEVLRASRCWRVDVMEGMHVGALTAVTFMALLACRRLTAEANIHGKLYEIVSFRVERPSVTDYGASSGSSLWSSSRQWGKPCDTASPGLRLPDCCWVSASWSLRQTGIGGFHPYVRSARNRAGGGPTIEPHSNIARRWQRSHHRRTHRCEHCNSFSRDPSVSTNTWRQVAPITMRVSSTRLSSC